VTEGGKAQPSLPDLPRRHPLAGFGILAVLELDALGQQLVADLVGLGPVLGSDEGEAFIDARINV
jgi:hypothetical protein